MHLLDNGVRLRDTTPFRHGILLGGVMEESSLIIRLDVADPIGVEIQAPDTGRPFHFSQPSMGVMLIRKGDRSASCFFPVEALARLQAGAVELSALLTEAWTSRGGDDQAVARNVRTVMSALNGQAHRVDQFGVKGWAPSLSMPFGLVLAGPWVGTPETAEVLSYKIEETA